MKKYLLFISLFISLLAKSQNDLGDIKCIAAANDRLFIATGSNSGIYELSNEGKTLMVKNKGFETKFPTCMAVSGNTIAIGTENQGIFLSKDSGENWEIANNGISIDHINSTEKTNKYRRIETIYFNNNILYIGVSGNKYDNISGLFKSTDNGQNWTSCDQFIGLKVTSIAGHEQMVIASTWGDGIFSSKDKGVTWQKMKLSRQIKDLFISDVEISGSTIFACTSSQNYYSLDNGGTWMLPKIDSKMERNSRNNLFTISKQDIFIGLNGLKGVSVSRNGTIEWEDFPGKLAYEDVKCISASENTVYVVLENNEIYVSPTLKADWKLAIAEKQLKAEAKQVEKKNEALAKERKLNYEKYKDEMYPVIIDYYRGLARYEYESYQAAILELNAAIAKKTDFEKAITTRMHCYQKLNQFEKVKADSLLLISNAKKTVTDTVLQRAFQDEFVYLEKQMIEKRGLNYMQCYYKDEKGWIREAQGARDDYDKIKYYSNAIDLNKTEYSYYLYRAQVYTELNIEKALEDLNKAHELKPSLKKYKIIRSSSDGESQCNKCFGYGTIGEQYLDQTVGYDTKQDAANRANGHVVGSQTNTKSYTCPACSGKGKVKREGSVQILVEDL